MSGLSLLLGYQIHSWRLPFLVSCAGLGLLAIGALLLLGGQYETPATVSGSLILATSHIMNWQRRHGNHRI